MCVTSFQCEVYGSDGNVRARPVGETPMRMCSGPHNVKPNSEGKNFFGLCTWRAILILVSGHHLCVRYLMLTIHPWAGRSHFPESSCEVVRQPEDTPGMYCTWPKNSPAHNPQGLAVSTSNAPI